MYENAVFLELMRRGCETTRERYLRPEDKYHLVDQGFRFARLGTKNMDYGRVLENIVAIEVINGVIRTVDVGRRRHHRQHLRPCERAHEGR